MVFFFILLLLLGALGQISSDLYLPSLPFIQQALGVSMSMVQLSLSLFLLGLAIAQLLYAPLSDYIGRRKPLLSGVMICFFGALICLTADSIGQLLIGRFIQGLGAGVGDSLSRAILRDKFHGEKLARFASILSIGHVALLAAAPFLGGYIQHFIGWRAVFFTLVIYSILLWFSLFFYLPETNRYFAKNKRLAIKNNFLNLLKSRHFVVFSLITALSYGGIIAWLTVAPALLEKELGFLPQHLGWIALILGIIFAIGSVFNAKQVVYVGLHRMIAGGLLMMLCSGVLMYVLYLKLGLNLMALLFPVSLFLFGASFVFSNGFAYALASFSDIAGLGCALFSFIQILGGVVTSSLMAYLHSTSQVTLALMMVSVSLVSILLQLCLTRPE